MVLNLCLILFVLLSSLVTDRTRRIQSAFIDTESLEVLVLMGLDSMRITCGAAEGHAPEQGLLVLTGLYTCLCSCVPVCCFSFGG